MGTQLSSLRAADRSGYLSQDTIAALATAPGGAIAVIRISGPGTRKALDRLSGGKISQEWKTPRSLHRARLVAHRDGSQLDDALVAYFVSPQSYTGEDVAELQIHGSAFVAQRILEELHSLGVRQALPGEFSFRAVRNGKMNLSQAHAVADLIASSNEGAVSLALEKMDGAQSRQVLALGEALRKLCSLGELGIDFADQDVDEVSLPSLKKEAMSVRSGLEALGKTFGRGSMIQEGVRTALVGLPNAGKSSFFNALLGEDRSIVSEHAGTTRDIVREKLTLKGAHLSVTLRMEDLAGLRQSADAVERIGVERAMKAAHNADLILLIVSPDTDLLSLEQEWASLDRPAARTLGILTKMDLVDSANARASFQKKLSGFGIESWVWVSALNGDGVHEAAQQIVKFCSRWIERGKNEILLTRLDHFNAVQESLEHLDRALNASEIDLFAADLRHAVQSLGPMIGETVADDILGRIFSEFCIGK